MTKPKTTDRPLNIYQPIKVKLTDKGREIMYQQYETFPDSFKERKSFDQYTPVDADGYSTFVLGHLMSVFGPHIKLGHPVPFDDDLILIDF